MLAFFNFDLCPKLNIYFIVLHLVAVITVVLCTEVIHHAVQYSTVLTIINRPGVAGTVLQTPLVLSNSVTHWSISSKSSKCLHSQPVRAREQTFWENVHPPPHVTYHMSHVTCHVSNVMCHMSHFSISLFYFFIFSGKVVELVGGGSGINGAYLV